MEYDQMIANIEGLLAHHDSDNEITPGLPIVTYADQRLADTLFALVRKVESLERFVESQEQIIKALTVHVNQLDLAAAAVRVYLAGIIEQHQQGKGYDIAEIVNRVLHILAYRKEEAK